LHYFASSFSFSNVPPGETASPGTILYVSCCSSRASAFDWHWYYSWQSPGWKINGGWNLAFPCM